MPEAIAGPTFAAWLEAEVAVAQSAPMASSSRAWPGVATGRCSSPARRTRALHQRDVRGALAAAYQRLSSSPVRTWPPARMQ